MTFLRPCTDCGLPVRYLSEAEMNSSPALCEQDIARRARNAEVEAEQDEMVAISEFDRPGDPDNTISDTENV